MHFVETKKHAFGNAATEDRKGRMRWQCLPVARVGGVVLNILSLCQVCSFLLWGGARWGQCFKQNSCFLPFHSLFLASHEVFPEKDLTLPKQAFWLSPWWLCFPFWSHLGLLTKRCFGGLWSCLWARDKCSLVSLSLMWSLYEPVIDKMWSPPRLVCAFVWPAPCFCCFASIHRLSLISHRVSLFQTLPWPSGYLDLI